MNKRRSIRYGIAGLVGALGVGALNGVSFLVVRTAGGLGPGVLAEATQAPIALSAVVSASVLGVCGALALRRLLGRLMVHRTARRVFLLISGLVFLLSLASPVEGLVGADLVDVLSLEGMHLTTAVVAVGAVEWATKPQWRFGTTPFVERRDIVPRTALVTGATSGIGAMVAVELARRGFAVIGIGRSDAKARRVEASAVGAAGSLTLVTGDLSAMREAVRLAAEVSDREPRGFSLLVHCAGILRPRSGPTAEGIDENFATSFLARVCLTRHLVLAAGARIVNVAAAERGGLPRFLRVELRRAEDIGHGMAAHGRAQLANDLYTASLARQGIDAIGYGPGAVRTDIRREIPALLRRLIAPLFWAQTRPAIEAAHDIVRLLLDPGLPRQGFADREGLFEHDPFILDPARQDRLVALATSMIDEATAATPTMAA